MTGTTLDAQEVRKAWEDEVEFIRTMRVYDKVPRSQALRSGTKVIGVRWIDINMGDSVNPQYRSRMVAKEYKDSIAHGLLQALRQ